MPGGGQPGSLDAGLVDTCTNQDTLIPLQGDRSEWIHIRVPEQCFGDTIGLFLLSPLTTPFDLEVYESPIQVCTFGCDASTSCPSLIGSSVAMTPDGGGQANASVTVANPGDVYAHVVAQPDAGCATGEVWTLGVFVQ
jgi:hypothetical protein